VEAELAMPTRGVGVAASPTREEVEAELAVPTQEVEAELAVPTQEAVEAELAMPTIEEAPPRWGVRREPARRSGRWSRRS
jgi:hypothetical protein